jgi:hypothetical protein
MTTNHDEKLATDGGGGVRGEGGATATEQNVEIFPFNEETVINRTTEEKKPIKGIYLPLFQTQQ